MKTAFIVYPSDYSRIAAPWTIGNNLIDFFKSKGWHVENYDWEDTPELKPFTDDDIIFGHPHEDDNMTFNKSYMNFRRQFAIMPFNNSQLKLCKRIAKNCDKFFGICGEPWHQKLQQVDHAVRLDIAIDHSKFPRIKEKFNEPGKRKAIFIGCTLPCKNPEFLARIAQVMPLTHVGYGHIPGATNIGYVQDIRTIFSLIAEHDFVIAASRFDANPTYILECMALGLIPMCNVESGWAKNDAVQFLLDDIKIFEIIARNMQERPDLLELQNHFMHRASQYTWEKFNLKIMQYMQGVL